MRTVFLLFDSLNRHMLEPYGGKALATPNFARLAARSATFDKHYVGSMPCMPARRDILTGRLGFMHRSWGPVEPFDICFTEVLQKAKGTYSHLATDHFHYWEDGGATYHNRYDSYDLIRGQEGDRWVAEVSPDFDTLRTKYHPAQFSEKPRSYPRAHMLNRKRIAAEDEFPSYQTVQAGLEFIETNRDTDNWFLQIECFDPHEPFHAPDRFKAEFDSGWDGPIRDWPPYGHGRGDTVEDRELRANYLASIAHCDALLGQVLDAFDTHDLWQDTALVVTTDHGFLLGEHDFWAKNRMNLYEELAHIPLFLHDPRFPTPGARVDALTQTPDLCATFLDLHDGPRPESVQGRSLVPMLQGAPGHDAVMFGFFGGAANVTDGRYTYFRFPEDLMQQELFQYTLMPTHIFDFFAEDELTEAELSPPMPFSRNMPLLKVPVRPSSAMFNTYGPGCLMETKTVLYDLQTDPGQTKPLHDPAAEARMIRLLGARMSAVSAPAEAFRRFDLTEPECVS
ncbi:sulfatase [Pseudoruegeria sp. SHC-113]|uniref:sulfatase n=1 Tax=Pseudoruegeria sp. SHC-113 TaxID=2855439 RepID=UPI0021BA3EE3|nr:sulfatase [Pseudoruegeria sp. SHC-113]MCT8159528.1 sulfatase [Pseudoruegeria sp. SHC-113]